MRVTVAVIHEKEAGHLSKSSRTTEFVVKGVITRLALFFHAQGRRKYTGEEIAEILLAAWQSYETFNSRNQPEG